MAISYLLGGGGGGEALRESGISLAKELALSGQGKKRDKIKLKKKKILES